VFTATQLKRTLAEFKTTPETILANANPEGYREWPQERQDTAIEQLLLLRSGFDPGKIDGLIGPQTVWAYALFRASDPDALAEFKDEDKDTEPNIVPAESPWPRQAGTSMDKFFGDKGANQGMLTLPFPMRIAWDKDQTITRMKLNEKVIESAGRVFEKIASRFDARERERFGMDLFGGSLAIRQMRGGTDWSVHSWGCAIDFDPERNQLRWTKRKATLASPECTDFWEFWEEEGWLSLGRARDYDWMHVQAARF
jgi:hypothetical protein